LPEVINEFLRELAVALVNQADVERHVVTFAKAAEDHQENQREKDRKENSQPVPEIAADTDFSKYQDRE
jgi:hypothetical protein